MKVQHTQGPWEAVTPCPGKCCWFIQPVGNDRGDFGYITQLETSKEDAQFIASAPMFLAELRRAREYISKHHQSFVETATSPKSGLIENPQDLLFAEADRNLLNGIDTVIAKAIGDFA